MTTLTVAQAAIELDLSPAAVRAAIRRGALPARKVLGRHRLAAADVRRAADGVSCFKETHNVVDSPPFA